MQSPRILARVAASHVIHRSLPRDMMSRIVRALKRRTRSRYATAESKPACVRSCRFNSITWAIDTSETFALGPSTIDPRTGEILHSAIIFTNGWISAWSKDFELFGNSPTDSSRRWVKVVRAPRCVRWAPPGCDLLSCSCCFGGQLTKT